MKPRNFKKPEAQSRKNGDKMFIYGRHPVEEILARSPSQVRKVFFKETIDPDFRKKITGLASRFGIPYDFIDDNRIRRNLGEVNHQGILAQIKGIEYTELKSWLGSLDMAKNPSCVVLDELTDPHNVGAIIRTACALGVSGIILGKHNQAGVTATVFKVSAGAALLIPIMRVANINAALDALKEKGFWIAGLAGDGETVIWKQDMQMPLAFIVGSEGEGIRAKTIERADFVIKIPMENAVESLNASVSTALVLYEWKRANKISKN